MTTTKKLAIAVVALSLAFVCAIGGTLAFLVAKSEKVVNTFTYGGIKIALTETKGTEKGGVREFENVVPGATIDKDPQVTVTENSENCYVYVKVENNVVLDGKVIVECNIDTSSWTVIDTQFNNDGSTVTLYRYKEIVEKSVTDTSLPELFKTVTFGDFKSENVETLDEITNDIVITAYAHQSDNTSDSIADAAAIAWAWPSN